MTECIVLLRETIMSVYCLLCSQTNMYSILVGSLWLQSGRDYNMWEKEYIKHEGWKAELWEKRKYCSHVPVHTLIKFMSLKTKINRPLHYVHPKGLKQTNDALCSTLLSAQPSSVFAALASAHYCLLKSLSWGEDKDVGFLTGNQGL